MNSTKIFEAAMRTVLETDEMMIQSRNYLTKMQDLIWFDSVDVWYGHTKIQLFKSFSWRCDGQCLVRRVYERLAAMLHGVWIQSSWPLACASVSRFLQLFIFRSWAQQRRLSFGLRAKIRGVCDQIRTPMEPNTNGVFICFQSYMTSIGPRNPESRCFESIGWIRTPVRKTWWSLRTQKLILAHLLDHIFLDNLWNLAGRICEKTKTLKPNPWASTLLSKATSKP